MAINVSVQYNDGLLPDIYVRMYVCIVTHIARVIWINRVRLPVLHVVS